MTDRDNNTIQYNRRPSCNVRTLLTLRLQVHKVHDTNNRLKKDMLDLVWNITLLFGLLVALSVPEAASVAFPMHVNFAVEHNLVSIINQSMYLANCATTT